MKTRWKKYARPAAGLAIAALLMPAIAAAQVYTVDFEKGTVMIPTFSDDRVTAYRVK